MTQAWDFVEASIEIERLRALLAKHDHDAAAELERVGHELAEAYGQIEVLQALLDDRPVQRPPVRPPDDIMERLREYTRQGAFDGIFKEAADEIERLRDERDEWRELFEAERNDHKATIAHCERIEREEEWRP